MLPLLQVLCVCSAASPVKFLAGNTFEWNSSTRRRTVSGSLGETQRQISSIHGTRGCFSTTSHSSSPGSDPPCFRGLRLFDPQRPLRWQRTTTNVKACRRIERELVGARQTVCSLMSSSVQPQGLKPTRLLCPVIFQAKLLEWVALSSSRGSSQPRD